MIRITVNDKVYTLNKMNPMDGMEYGMEVLGVITPSMGGVMEATKEGGDATKAFLELGKALKDKGATDILKKALKQCYTPEGESLEDIVAFNKWFQAHPGDMFQLAVVAVWHLVKDFLPSQLATIASSWQTKLTVMATANQSASQSQTGGKQGQ